MAEVAMETGSLLLPDIILLLHSEERAHEYLSFIYTDGQRTKCSLDLDCHLRWKHREVTKGEKGGRQGVDGGMDGGKAA